MGIITRKSVGTEGGRGNVAGGGEGRGQALLPIVVLGDIKIRRFCFVYEAFS